MKLYALKAIKIFQKGNITSFMVGNSRLRLHAFLSNKCSLNCVTSVRYGANIE